MKKLALIIIVAFLVSCGETKPYIKHTIQIKKKGDCTVVKSPTGMTSNTLGERYVYDYCLPEGFNEKDYTVVRRGDTLFVEFKNTIAVTEKSLYTVTLDINAYPKYHFIQLASDGELLNIIPSEY